MVQRFFREDPLISIFVQHPVDQILKLVGQRTGRVEPSVPPGFGILPPALRVVGRPGQLDSVFVLFAVTSIPQTCVGVTVTVTPGVRTCACVRAPGSGRAGITMPGAQNHIKGCYVQGRPWTYYTWAMN